MMKNIFLLLVFSGLLNGLNAQNLPAYLPANGLVGWWPFNGNANDESGNGNHGIVNGATLTADRFGNEERATAFNGLNDFIRIPRNSVLEPEIEITLSCWFKISPDYFGSTFVTKSLLSNGNSSYGLAITRQIVGTDFSFGDDFAQSSISPSNWYNLVVAFNGQFCRIYLNGIQKTTSPRTGQFSYNAQGDLFFGVSNELVWPRAYFGGILDDIAIWNRALSQEEITQLYQAGNETSLSYQLTQEKLGNCPTSPVKLYVKTRPRISTDSVQVNANGDAAMAYGNILNDGGKNLTRRGFCWGTSANPTLSNSSSENGNGSGSFSGNITGLSSNSSYFIRAYAGTDTEVWYGNEITISVGNTLHTCGTPGVHNASKVYGTMTDQDGNSYKTIQIGEQEWMAENLKTSHFMNGDLIPILSDSISWALVGNAASCWYKNDSLKYACPFGKLYNGYSAVDPRGLCPIGWHVPSRGEWLKLYNNYSENPAALIGLPTVSYGIGGSNESGFSSISSGARFSYYPNQGYWVDGISGLSEFIPPTGPAFWCSNDSSEYLGFHISFQPALLNIEYPKPCGFSVRCVKDTVATGSITGMQCSEMVLSGNGPTQFLSANELQVSIPYSGGNGASYNEQIIPSTGVTGLCARLIPDRFNQGAGNLNLRIGGTPKTAGTAHFQLQIGGVSCGFQLEVGPNPLMVNCGAARIERQVTPLFPASNIKNLTVFCKMPYAGAMDPVFIPSTQVQGLWANLARSGISDELSFIISGKPASSGTAVFQIPIGQGCSFSIPVDTATSAACGFPAVHHSDVAFFDTVSDQDGNVYRTIRIGSQLWMAENLRSGRYANGDLIPVKSDLNDWGDTTLGATCWYNNDSSANHCPLGRLYNHYAVQDERGLCPAGWRVAGNEDFSALFSGLNEIQGPGCETMSIYAPALKSKALWEAGLNCASNFSGFSALPGGYRSGLFEQDFAGLGTYTSWWLSDNAAGSTNIGAFYGINSDIQFGTENAAQGRSVRCIKD